MGSGLTLGLSPRMYSAPMPLGPYILCAENDIRSMFIASTSIGMCPTAWAASVWNITLFSWAILPISAMSAMVPISLFCRHYRYHHGILGNCLGQILDVDPTAPIHRHVCHLFVNTLKMSCCIQYSFVFGGTRDEVITPIRIL